MDDKPVVITVPTSLRRIDPFWHVFAAAAAAVASKALVDNYHVPWPLLVPPLLGVALWSLTSDEATDMRYIGWLASLLRSRLGQRRIDEWGRAVWHYWRVAAGPRLKERCSARLALSLRVISGWRRMVNAWTVSRLSPACSWALRTKSSSSRQPAK
jgi:hypothetical protein